jgi:hypothetical protein
MTIYTKMKNIFILFFISTLCSAQVRNFDKGLFKGLNKDTTFVIMKDPSAKEVQGYKEVFLKYMPYANIKFIDFSEIKNIKRVGNSFIALTCVENSAWGKCECYKDTFQIEFVRYVADLRTPKKINRMTMATIEIKPSREIYTWVPHEPSYSGSYTLGDGVYAIDVIIKENFDGGGYLVDWSPEILSFSLRTISTYISTDVSKAYLKKFKRDRFRKLAHDTLYFTYKLRDTQPNGDPYKVKPKDAYPYIYKEITIEEFYKMLNEDKSFLFVIENSIFDSSSGLMIYHTDILPKGSFSMTHYSSYYEEKENRLLEKIAREIKYSVLSKD